MAADRLAHARSGSLDAGVLLHLLRETMGNLEERLDRLMGYGRFKEAAER